MTTPRRDTVHLFVFDGFADWEPAFATAALNQPDFQREPGRWRVRTVSADGAPVRSMGGLRVQPDGRLDEVAPDASALLLLPGGPGWDHGDDDDGGGAETPLRRAQAQAVEVARRLLAAGVPVAAICGATAGLARAGLLQGRRHTSNAAAYLKGTGYADGEGYEDAAAVQDRGLVTAGGMAPLEFAREILQCLGVYDDETLQAWYQLYKTGQSAWFARLTRAAEAAA